MKRFGVMTLALALLFGLNAAFAGGEAVDLSGLKSKAPESWKKQKPANKFRLYQFSIPKVDGDKEDAELVVFYFGEGGGGTNQANIQRWKGQFLPPEGKTIDEATKVSDFKIGKSVEVAYVDIEGTYKSKFPPFDPNAKETRKPHFRRIGVIFDCKGGPYFITLTGPAKTMAKNKDAFDGWIKAFK